MILHYKSGKHLLKIQDNPQKIKTILCILYNISLDTTYTKCTISDSTQTFDEMSASILMKINCRKYCVIWSCVYILCH
jgi:BarA-like signal transduction histidine kinase